jgi:hypothetical protein
MKKKIKHTGKQFNITLKDFASMIGMDVSGYNDDMSPKKIKKKK